LNGTVNGNGSGTTASFEYGQTASYGSSASAGLFRATVNGATPVSAAISGLTCSTTYHFRVTATNIAGTVSGADQTFTAGPCPQTITFAPLSARTVGGADFDPGATASSGLPVSYSSSNTGVATIVNGKIHLVAPGTATIIASQAGGGSWGAATDVSQTLTVNAATATLSVSLLGTGGGSVNSDPAGIACVTGSSSGCANSFNTGAPVTLTALQDWKSTFTGWGLPCSGTGSCIITLTGDRGVSATFAMIPRVRITGPTPVDYGSLQDACDHAASGDTFRVKVYTFSENLVLSRPVAFTFDGGWSDNFLSIVGNTTLHGTLSIEQGAATINNLIIE
jgi:hypothetical protein